ncbi:MAG: pyridoxal phosphate-dependent aminotransferase [Propionicimonas sp.]
MSPAGLAAGGGWRAAARGSGLLGVGPDGSEQVAPTIFAEMSALAVRTGAINLGQGFPDTDGPAWIARAARDAIRAGHNQYPPGPGIPELRRAVAEHQRRHYDLPVDPDTEVLITTGATEALAAALLALVGPGDEVITLEPFYDSYGGVIGLAGASHVPVGLLPSPDGFRLDVAALRAAASPRTRLILVNTPHNPTGAVLDAAELAAIAQVATDCDAIVLTDEVYEHLTYDDAVHVPLATLPGMADRTLTVSSAGKTFSFTGWKIGWIHGPAELITTVRTVKQFLTYVSGAPFQPAIAQALVDDRSPRELASSLAGRRDLLCAGLAAAGFAVTVPRGTYFVVADGAPLGFPDGVELCRRLPELAGVVAIPMTAFCREGSASHAALRSSLRFTFVKRPEVLRQAVSQLGRLASR